jgi:hypothetical protein
VEHKNKLLYDRTVLLTKWKYITNFDTKKLKKCVHFAASCTGNQSLTVQGGEDPLV